MHTPHKRNAPGAEARGASKVRSLQWDCRDKDTPTRPDLQALETLAEWKESLDTRFQRAQMQFGLVGMNASELRALFSEGQAWKHVCAALLHDGEGA